MIRPDEVLKVAKEALDKALANQKLNKEFIASIGPAIMQALQPTLDQIAENSKISREEMLEAFSQIKIDVPQANVPEARVTVHIPEIKVPQPIVNVTVPEIKLPEMKEIKLPAFPKIPRPEITINPKFNIPDIKMPEEMDVRGWISLMGYDRGFLTNPLPVQLRDSKGNPLNLFENLSKIINMGGSGGGNSLIINDANHPVPVTGTFSASFSGSSLAAVLTNNAGLTYNSDNPLPVSGSFSASLAAAIGQGDGSAALRTIQAGDSISSVYVQGMAASSFAEIMNPDGRVKVELPTGASGLTDTELRASHLDTQQVSGSMDSVNVANFAGNPAVVGSGYQDNAMRVVMATDSIVSVNVVSDAVTLDKTTDSISMQQVSGAVDSVYVNNPAGPGEQATALRILQAGDAVSSVYVNNPVDNGDSATALRVVVAGNSSASVSAAQSGLWPIQVQDAQGSSITSHQFNTDFRGIDVYIGGIFSTLGASIMDSSGVQYSGSNPLPVTIVSGGSATSASNIVDSSGVAYSGSNPLPITLISGALTSTVAVGDSAARTADNGGNPVKIGGIARTTNPAAYADGDRSNIATDKIGRTLMRNLQVRDLLATAYTTVNNGTETTILTAAAGTFLDCIWMMFANTSGASQNIDIRAVSGGNIIHTAVIPANSTIGWAPPAPWPQDATGNAWTADGADVTNSTVYITSLFSKEI